MKVKGKEIKVPHCPECTRLTQVTVWLPPQGVDPQLREFRCSSCGSVFYMRSTREIRRAIAFGLLSVVN